MEEYGEEFGEQSPKIAAVPGEGGWPPTEIIPPAPLEPPVILEKKLTFEEASKCLNTLGKDESGVRYAYLMMTAINKNLTDVSVILKFKHVHFLDLSGNYLDLDSLQVLTEMPYLIYLKAEKNSITSAALRRMPYLQVLLLGYNSIFDTAEIDQPILQTLDLNNNKIFKAEFDHILLTELKVLSLHGNQIEDFSGTYPTSIEELYLAQNNIKKFNASDLALMRNLKILHLRNNRIKKLNGFSQSLENLTYLNLRGNSIRAFRQFRKLQCLPKLTTLIILENPVAPGPAKIEAKGEGQDQEEDAEDEMMGEGGEPELRDPCVIPLLVLLPNLTRINKHMVTLYDRDEASFVKTTKLQEIMSEVSSEEEDAAGTSEYTETDILKTIENSVMGEEEESEEHEDDEEEDDDEEEEEDTEEEYN